MRGQVPENVHIRLHQAQIDADRIDVQDLAQFAGLEQLADLEHRGGVAIGVVGHQDGSGGTRRLHHLGPVHTVVGQRLLHQHVLAGCNGRHRDSMVGAGRRGNGHRIDLVVPQQLIH
ncbi:hypothetical protein D9M71_825320 [compost metagenome]